MPAPKAGAASSSSSVGVTDRAGEDDEPNGLVGYGDDSEQGSGPIVGAGADIVIMPATAGKAEDMAADVIEYDEFGDPVVQKEKKKKNKSKKNRARKAEGGDSLGLPEPKRPKTDEE
jgi:hypothetical protein